MLTPAHLLASLVLRSPIVLAYVGPDQILPVASVLSAIAGIALMFWNKLVSFVGLGWSMISGRSRPAPQASPDPAPRAETGE
jgi:hypothetical protein